MRRRFYNRETAVALGLIAGLGLSLGTAQAFDGRLGRPLRRSNRTPISQTVTPSPPPAEQTTDVHQVSLKTVVDANATQAPHAVATINGHEIVLNKPQIVKRHYKTDHGTSDVVVKFDKSTNQSSGSQTNQTTVEISSSSSASADTSVNLNKTRGSP